MTTQQKIDISKNILKELEEKTEIDYCGLYYWEVLSLIFNQLEKRTK